MLLSLTLETIKLKIFIYCQIEYGCSDCILTNGNSYTDGFEQQREDSSTDYFLQITYLSLDLRTIHNLLRYYRLCLDSSSPLLSLLLESNFVQRLVFYFLCIAMACILLLKHCIIIFNLCYGSNGNRLLRRSRAQPYCHVHTTSDASYMWLPEETIAID